jgi:hypothetical protein
MWRGFKKIFNRLECLASNPADRSLFMKLCNELEDRFPYQMLYPND